MIAGYKNMPVAKTGVFTQEFIDLSISRWQARLDVAAEDAVSLCEKIMGNWDTDSWITVIDNAYNPYMVLAAMRILAQDLSSVAISDEQFARLIEVSKNTVIQLAEQIPLHAEFEDELDERKRLAEADDRCQNCGEPWELHVSVPASWGTFGGQPAEMACPTRLDDPDEIDF
jgi:hypothetical protein